MTQCGLDASVAFGFAWRDPGLCRTNNDYVLERAAGSGGRIIPFCVVPPENLDFAAGEIARCRKMGAVGVGEIFPEGQAWNLIDGEKTRAFVDIAREFGMAITLHTSEPIGHSYAGKDRTALRELWSVVEASQGDIPIILAEVLRFTNSCPKSMNTPKMFSTTHQQATCSTTSGCTNL